MEEKVQYLLSYHYTTNEVGSTWGFGSRTIECDVRLRPEDITPLEKDIIEELGVYNAVISGFSKFE